MKKKERRPFSTNYLERKILKVVFLSSGIPVLIVVGFFYCLFSDLINIYLGSSMADNFLQKILNLSIIILLYYFLFVGILAYRFVHKLVGAFPRVLREMDEKIMGKSQSPIRLRHGDYAKELITRINALIDRIFK